MRRLFEREEAVIVAGQTNGGIYDFRVHVTARYDSSRPMTYQNLYRRYIYSLWKTKNNFKI